MNDYKIFDEYTSIYITNKKNINFEVLVDTQDINSIMGFSSNWHVAYDQDIDNYYVVAFINKKVVLLHRFILRDILQKKDYVDHVNNNTLDNRKGNLRITSNSKNNQNRKSKNSNNKSGYRNVCRINNRWVVQLQIDGKNTRLQSFPLAELEQAGEYAEEMRQQHYGEFAGNK